MLHIAGALMGYGDSLMDRHADVNSTTSLQTPVYVLIYEQLCMYCRLCTMLTELKCCYVEVAIGQVDSL